MPQLLPEFGSGYFYANQILASLVLGVGLGLIDKHSLMVTLVIILTTLFALFNLIVLIGYHYETYLFRDSYDRVSNILNTMELMVLLTGTAIGFAHGDDNRMGVIDSFRDLFSFSGLVTVREDEEWKG